MNKTKDLIPETFIERLKKQHYGLFGHSAVKACHYTKTSIKGEKVCYKQKFYGIQCHQCIQMTPASAFCNQRCIFCWRPITGFDNKLEELNENELDKPEEIVEESLKMQKKLLSGLGGIPNQIDSQKFAESKKPRHVAISLAGEPTLYKKLPELIQAYHKRGISTFLVSNGTNPEMLEKMLEDNKLPTQLYISLDASNSELHEKVNKPSIPAEDNWKKILKTLKMLPRIGEKTRTAIRITCIKDYNMEKEEEYAQLLKTASPDFIEVKAYMHVGFSKYRLEEDNMPSMDLVREFTEKINKNLEYTIADESIDSRIVLLSKGIKPGKIDFSKIGEKNG